MTVQLVPAPRQVGSISPAKRIPRARARGVPDLHRVTKAEVDFAIAHFQRPGRPDLWALLVRFLWVTGARISEAIAVTPHDFDFGAPCVRLRTLKRRVLHYRALPLPPSLCGELAQWFMWARPGPEDRIFPWRRAGAARVVARVLMEGGVDRRRAHPHSLRHGHAFHALEHGVPVPALQYALGHAHLSTTAVYTRATGADLRAAYDRVNW